MGLPPIRKGAKGHLRAIELHNPGGALPITFTALPQLGLFLSSQRNDTLTVKFQAKKESIFCVYKVGGQTLL